MRVTAANMIGILALHILLVALPASARTQKSVPLSADDWQACLHILRLDEDIAGRGSYTIRMQHCIDQREDARRLRDLGLGTSRITMRSLRYQQAISSGQFRPVKTHSHIRGIDATALGARKITPKRRENPKPVTYYRPSVRLIKQRAFSQTQEEKQIHRDRFQEHWNKAIESCRHIDYHFHRSNCINKKLRQLGSQ